MGYYNGSYGELDSIFVPMCDRACYFGDGIYDVAYCYNHKIFALEEHTKRFIQSAKKLRINFEMSDAELQSLLRRMADKVKGNKLCIYFQLSRGTGRREHSFSKTIMSNLWIMIYDSSLRDMTAPITLDVSSDKRHGLCDVKTLNLIPNILAFQQAKEKGCDEVVLHKKGIVTECAHSNISILKNGSLVTPPSDGRIFPGIGREHLLRACEKAGIMYQYNYFTLEDLFNADEIIITAAGSLCIDVCTIDGRKVAGKDQGTLKKLRDMLILEFNDFTGATIEGR